MQTIELRDIKPALALAVYRRALVRRIGILNTRSWVQHIAYRWRDAVSNRHKSPADIELQQLSSFSTTPIVALPRHARARCLSTKNISLS